MNENLSLNSYRYLENNLTKGEKTVPTCAPLFPRWDMHFCMGESPKMGVGTPPKMGQLHLQKARWDMSRLGHNSPVPSCALIKHHIHRPFTLKTQRIIAQTLDISKVNKTTLSIKYLL